MGFPGILLTKFLINRFGQKWTGVASAVLINVALLGSAWTVRLSVAWTAVLMGAVVGWAGSINIFVALQNVSGWSPNRVPIFMATTVSFSSGLSMVQNQLITAYVNPGNLKPDVNVGPKTYFSQPEILVRVPNVIIMYACITSGLQFIGYLLMTSSPKNTEHVSPSKSLDVKETETDVLSSGQNGHTRTLESLKNSDEQAVAHQKKHYGCRVEYIDQPHVSNLVNGKGNSTNPVKENVHELDLSSEILVPEAQPRAGSMESSEVLKTPVFYALLVYGIAISFAYTVKCNYYKQFGLLYIHDDHLLTLAGTLIPIASTIARLLYGMLLDKSIISMKDSMIFSLALNAVLCAFWFFVPQVNAILYVVFIILLPFAHGSFYVILPTGCLWNFGPEHFSINYGLLNAGDLVVGFLGPLMITNLLHTLGWVGLFTLTCGFSIFALVLTLFVNFKQLS